MLSKPEVILFGCMALMTSTILSAETSAMHGDRTINMQEAINRTLSHNPALNTLNFQRKAQDARTLQASLRPSSKVSLNVEDALGTGKYEGSDNAQATLSIGWVIEGELRQNYIDVARAGELSLKTEIEMQQLDAAAETARLFLIGLANQARLINAKKNLDLANETLSIVKKRVTAGKTPGAELARAQVEVARRELVSEDIEHEIDSSNHLLAAQWGNVKPSFTWLEGDIFSLPTSLTFDELKMQLVRSPELIRVLSDKGLKQAELKLAEAQSNPAWQLDLGMRHYQSTSDQALVAGISIPFGERSRNTGGIAEAQANLSQVMAKNDELKVRIETMLYVLYQELQHDYHRVNSYRNKIIPQLELALNKTQKAYKLGRYSYLEWLSVQVSLLDARSELVEASVDAHLKVIEIERLTGVRMVQPVSKAN